MHAIAVCTPVVCAGGTLVDSGTEHAIYWGLAVISLLAAYSNQPMRLLLFACVGCFAAAAYGSP
jgi:hypothetical protein